MSQNKGSTSFVRSFCQAINSAWWFTVTNPSGDGSVESMHTSRLINPRFLGTEFGILLLRCCALLMRDRSGKPWNLWPLGWNDFTLLQQWNAHDSSDTSPALLMSFLKQKTCGFGSTWPMWIANGHQRFFFLKLLRWRLNSVWGFMPWYLGWCWWWWGVGVVMMSWSISWLVFLPSGTNRDFFGRICCQEKGDKTWYTLINTRYFQLQPPFERAFRTRRVKRETASTVLQHYIYMRIYIYFYVYIYISAKFLSCFLFVFVVLSTSSVHTWCIKNRCTNFKNHIPYASRPSFWMLVP